MNDQTDTPAEAAAKKKLRQDMKANQNMAINAAFNQAKKARNDSFIMSIMAIYVFLEYLAMTLILGQTDDSYDVLRTLGIFVLGWLTVQPIRSTIHCQHHMLMLRNQFTQLNRKE